MKLKISKEKRNPLRNFYKNKSVVKRERILNKDPTCKIVEFTNDVVKNSVVADNRFENCS